MHTRSLQNDSLKGRANGAPAVNRLLDTLPKKEYARLLPKLKSVNLVLGEVLYEPGDLIRYVYFPNDSIVSLISEVSGTSWLEVGMVGNEGVAGLAVFMGVSSSPTRALVQGSGTAMRMSSAAVRTEANRLGGLHDILHRYSHSLLAQVSQSSVCNRFHLVDARLARWLLMTNDRLGAGEFPLTQVRCAPRRCEQSRQHPAGRQTDSLQSRTNHYPESTGPRSKILPMLQNH
jgi:CRP-like cAMP-binding protein